MVRGVVPLVQIDLCDGIFVPSQTWPFSTGGMEDYNFHRIMNEEEGMPFWEEVDFELDLMVADAVENFDLYLKLGARRMIFHIEAMESVEEFKHFLEGIDPYVRDTVSIGVAINSSTPASTIFPIINLIEFVQCMGIARIGYQGEKFDERCIENIKILKEKYPDLVIAVDGSVNLETAPLLVEAGAERLAAGSVIFNSNAIINTIEQLRDV
jgi:ribulose-phosphate 3-epimerase